jgi:hypothetical protein
LALTTHPPVQKIPGDAAATSVQQTINAGTPEPLTENPQTNPFYFRNTGKPRLALKTPRRSLHAGKVPNGVGLEKPAAPLPSPPNRRKIVSSFVVTLSCSVVLWSWRRDLNPRPPDYKSGALPTELRQQLGKGAPSRKLIPLIPARCPGQLIKLSQRELLAQARCIGAHRRTSPPRVGTYTRRKLDIADKRSQEPQPLPAHLLAHVTLKSCTKRSGLCRRARWPNITDSLMSD